MRFAPKEIRSDKTLHGSDPDHAVATFIQGNRQGVVLHGFGGVSKIVAVHLIASGIDPRQCTF